MSPGHHSFWLFGRLLQHLFRVKLQQCFVDWKIYSNLPSTFGSLDNDLIFISGWTIPLSVFILNPCHHVRFTQLFYLLKLFNLMNATCTWRSVHLWDVIMSIFNTPKSPFTGWFYLFLLGKLNTAEHNNTAITLLTRFGSLRLHSISKLSFVSGSRLLTQVDDQGPGGVRWNTQRFSSLQLGNCLSHLIHWITFSLTFCTCSVLLCLS